MRGDHRQAIAAVFLLALTALAVVLGTVFRATTEPETTAGSVEPAPLKIEKDPYIKGHLLTGQTLGILLGDHGIPAQVIHAVDTAARRVFNFRNMRAGQPYRFRLSEDGGLEEFEYTIDDFSKVKISRDPKRPDLYVSDSIPIVYDIETATIKGTIRDNLFNSLENAYEPARLAIELAEIFAWDIDFSTDLKKGDSYEMLIEERWQAGQFKKYGKILMARFTNEGQTYEAYYYNGGKDRTGYFDRDGRPLKRGFLSSPLKFAHITSRFSKGRLHPILKVVRPHYGVDYAAPSGTPVQAASEGVVRMASWSGGFGNLLVLQHPNGYETYYGHLSRFGQGVRAGSRVSQGEVIGYVGSTGLSTGPHLDYRVRLRGGFVDPLKLKMVKPEPLGGELLASYRRTVEDLSTRFKNARYAKVRNEMKAVGAIEPIRPQPAHSS